MKIFRRLWMLILFIVELIILTVGLIMLTLGIPISGLVWILTGKFLPFMIWEYAEYVSEYDCY